MGLRHCQGGVSWLWGLAITLVAVVLALMGTIASLIGWILCLISVGICTAFYLVVVFLDRAIYSRTEF